MDSFYTNDSFHTAEQGEQSEPRDSRDLRDRSDHPDQPEEVNGASRSASSSYDTRILEQTLAEAQRIREIKEERERQASVSRAQQTAYDMGRAVQSWVGERLIGSGQARKESVSERFKATLRRGRD